MTGVITSGAFPKALRSEVFAYTQMMYKEMPQYWRELFYSTTSELEYEELVSGNTFALVPVKPQGANIAYASENQANVTRATHVVYAMGYITTYEERLNNKSKKLSMQRGARLSRAFVRTEEQVHANQFNRAFNGTYTFGDESAWMVNDHSTVSGDQSNILAIAADMSEASIEDLTIQIRKALDNVGNHIDLQPACLVYAPDNSPEACRILESELQNDTANNAVNYLKSKGRIPKHFDWPYLDDTDAWFILTDLAKTEEGLVHFEREGFNMKQDNDSNNMNEKNYGYHYYSVTMGDFRSGFGTPGA